MAEIEITEVQLQMLQKEAADEYLLLHPETDAELVKFESSKIEGVTNVADALEKLEEQIVEAAGGGVTGVKGDAEETYRTGQVNITKANIGLGNVDNTADTDKPVSTAVQTALNKKQDTLEYDDAPTANSENSLTSGAVYAAIKDFITNAVDDLTNYYSKDDIDRIIVGMQSLKFKVVEELPTEGEAYTFYFVPSTTDEHIFDAYYWDGEKFLETGSAKWSLEGYVTTAELETAIADFITEDDVKTLLADYQKKLTFDETPTADSTNPVTSGGIKVAIDGVNTTATNAKTAADTANETLTKITEGTTEVGKAKEAGKLSAAIKVEITGDVTASAETDGSEDVTLNATLASSGVTAGTYSVVTVNAKGLATVGAQIVEVGAEGQEEPSSLLAIGGIFFKRISKS